MGLARPAELEQADRAEQAQRGRSLATAFDDSQGGLRVALGEPQARQALGQPGVARRQVTGTSVLGSMLMAIPGSSGR